MVDAPKINGWNEWSKYVLKELERLNGCYEKLDGKLDNIATDLLVLKTKAGVIGAASAFVVTIIAQVIIYYVKYH